MYRAQERVFEAWFLTFGAQLSILCIIDLLLYLYLEIFHNKYCYVLHINGQNHNDYKPQNNHNFKLCVK